MVENRQKVFVYMGSALRAAYGIANPTASHGGPFSFNVYLNKMLKRGGAVGSFYDVGPQNHGLELQDASGVPCATQLCLQTRGRGAGVQLPHSLFNSRSVRIVDGGGRLFGRNF